MLRLMQIPEINTVMLMWEKSIYEQFENKAESIIFDNLQLTKEMYETSNVYLYEFEGKIIAYVSIVEGGYIENIFVHEEYRNKLIASTMIKLLQEKYDELITDVPSVNHIALQLYKNCHFVQEETILNENLGLEEVSLYWSHD